MQKRIAVLASASVFTIAVGIGFLNGRSETTSRSISKKPYTVADAPSFTAPRPESRSPASATRLPRLGVYKWDVRGIGDLPAYEKWLGSEVEVAEAFTNRWQWSDIGADWSLGPWSQWLAEKPGRRTLLYTIPMVRRIDGSMNGM
ncbi:MAG: hypothetical protein EOP05_02385 [Proteobacteria bacterium]|nr:MAG: hypothetical protein EOP05_02385 [Pseudomonadota bacterium]